MPVIIDGVDIQWFALQTQVLKLVKRQVSPRRGHNFKQIHNKRRSSIIPWLIRRSNGL
jgi:hypothetical protein